jgi:hypothetical protein
MTEIQQGRWYTQIMKVGSTHRLPPNLFPQKHRGSDEKALPAVGVKRRLCMQRQPHPVHSGLAMERAQHVLCVN